MHHRAGADHLRGQSTTSRTTGSPSRRPSVVRTTETDTICFTGGTNTGCGAANAQVGPFYCPADGLVYFDLDFLHQLQDQFGATGDLAAQYIVAHEYGHHMQNLLGTSSEVSRRSSRTRGTPTRYSVALELQADCFAGAWAHDADGAAMLEPGEISEALNAAAAVGDDRIQMQAGPHAIPSRSPTARRSSACSGSAAASRPATRASATRSRAVTRLSWHGPIGPSPNATGGQPPRRR